tara:strand:+ start:1334 stop:1564 length:231 start_codon:yes stop_codon:yes gene_type:complete
MGFNSQPIDFDKKKNLFRNRTEFGSKKIDDSLMLKVEITESDKWELKSQAYKVGMTLQQLIGNICREYIAEKNELP